MAIYAEVSFRQLSVSASYRQIHAAASLPVAAVVIETQSPSTEVSFQNLFLSVSHQLLTPQLTWQNLFVSDVVLNAEKTITIFTDELGFGDAPVFSLATSLDEAFAFSDISALNLDSQRLDNFPLSDASSLQFTSAQSDTFGFGDSQVLSVDKALSDEAGISDVFARVFAFARSFSDSSAIDDQFSFSSSKVEGHLFGFSDASVLSVTKGESEAVSVTEIAVKTASKAPIDAALISEDNLILSTPQSGFSFEVQSDGDLAISGLLSESVIHQDTPSVTLERAFSDAFTMDEAANVGLGYLFDKSNIYTMTDSLSFGFSREPDESIILEDSLAKTFGFGVSDSSAITELVTLTTGTVLTDNVSMSESFVLVLGGFSQSSILNKGLVGSMLLNAE